MLLLGAFWATKINRWDTNHSDISPANFDHEIRQPRPQGETRPRVEPPLGICEQPLDLELGRRVVRDSSGAESCIYNFFLEAGDYLELVVEQYGVDVVVTLLEPEEVEQIRVDSMTGAKGPELLQVVAQRSGNHRLKISSAPMVSLGRYELRVEAWRLATPRDRASDRGARALSKAEKRRRARELGAAEELYREALNHWRAAEEIYPQAVVLSRIGWLYKRRRVWRKALHWYQLSLEHFARTGSSRRQVPKILNDVGLCHWRLGEWEEALASYDHASRIAQNLGDRREGAASLNNAAIVYKSLGRFQLAISHYERAVTQWQEEGDRTEEAYTWVNVAWLYIGLGQSETAREALNRALELTRAKVEDRSFERGADLTRLRLVEASALNALAKAQRRQGQFTEALASLRRCLELRRGLPGQPGVAMTLKGLGRSYFELDQPEQALQAYRQAIDLARARGNRRIEGVLLNELGWLYNEAFEQPEQALHYYRIAREIFQQKSNSKEEASSLFGMARAMRSRGELAEARSLIEKALEIVESLRAEPDDPKDRAYFLADKQDYYELNIDLLIGLHHRDPTAGYAARALEISEHRRARTLLEVMSASLGDQETEEALRRSKGLPPSSIDPRDGEIWPPSSIGPQQPILLSFREIRQLLGDDTLLLEYSLGESRSFLWLVSSQGLEIHELPPRSEIKVLAELASEKLSKSYRRSTRGSMQWATRELSRMLLGKVADRLGNKRLLVVREESLLYVPFAALPAPASATRLKGQSRYLVEEHEIVYLPSMSVLSLLRRQLDTRPTASKQVAVIADPIFDVDDSRVVDRMVTTSAPGDENPLPLPRLELSREEAVKILSFVSEQERFSAFDFDANKQLVLDGGLAEYRFIHLATHAFFDQENPEFMGVALSQVDAAGRLRDGLLRPHEIYRLSLPVEMVTLSACQSGLGKAVRGEGLVGLTQSFLDAGAGRVVVSFWRVDDRATSELMEWFYRAIFEDGLRPAAALRDAQLSMLRDSRWKQAPYYWAGFFLQGEWL